LAQPHRRHQAHKAAHVKKDVVTVVSTAYGEATAASEVVILVNDQGVPVSTYTHFMENEAVPTPSPVPTTSISVSAAPITTTSSTPVVSSFSSSVSIASSSTSSAATSPSAGFSSGGASGLAYSPYNGDGSCKTASQVMEDLGSIPTGAYGRIRTYGCDCNTVENVLAACKAYGYKLWAGIFSLSTLESDIATIVAAAAGDWSDIAVINIGNELVNSGAADAGTVVAAVEQARGLLRTANFEGPVTTVDTCIATLSNPELCDKSDICTCNCHPFFDDNTAASGSGAFLTNMITSLRGVLANANQEIIIAETGYPNAGYSHGLADPTPENQAAALSSIKAAFSGNPGAVNYFSSFNTAWKEDSAYTYGAEKFWGIYGDCPSG